MLAQQPYERIGYTKAVDWWSLGVTMYKLLCGAYPFSDDIPNWNSDDSTGIALSYNIIRYAVLFDEVDFSTLTDYPEVCDFISRLLDVDERTRLGAGSQGHLHIHNHAVFNGLDWKLLAAKKLRPPFLPDHKTVDPFARPRYSSLEDMIKELDKKDWLSNGGPLKREVQRYFDGWDYSSPGATLEEYAVYKARQGSGSAGALPESETPTTTVNRLGQAINVGNLSP